MFIAITRKDNQTTATLYNNYVSYIQDTFSPDIEQIEIIDFKIKGKDYNQKKACLCDIAREYQNNYSIIDNCYYMSEVAEIGAFLEKNAKRFGCLQEFRENAII